MRIAMVIEQFNLAKGGQERSTLEIAVLLARRGMDVTIVTASSAGVPDAPGVRIIDLNVTAASRSARFMEFLKRAEVRIKQEKFDLVHAITPIRSADVYQPRGGLIDETFRQNLARHYGLGRWIRRAVGPNLRQRLVRRMEQKLAAETNCQFLAVSDYVRRQCREHLKLPEERIHTIFNGVDLARLAETNDPDRRAHFRKILKIREDQLAGVFAATNFKLKGLTVVIDSAAILRERRPELMSRFKFLVVGPDKVRAFFNRVHERGLAEFFLFLGPTKDMGLVYGGSDFLIHPTWYDPCSRVVLEGMACGLPILTTRFNGAGEIVRQVDCGFILENPGDPEELARHYPRLLEPQAHLRFRENALAARPKISMEYHVEQLVKFYQQVKEKQRQETK